MRRPAIGGSPYAELRTVGNLRRVVRRMTEIQCRQRATYQQDRPWSATNVQIAVTADVIKGLDAWIERRKPTYQGR